MIALIGLLDGIALGFVLEIRIPDVFATYLSVAILAALDSVFGAVKSNLAKTFEPTIFISGFFGNALIAVALTYLGDKLGIPMYLAAVLVFGGRIFNNFAVIRRLLLEKLSKKEDSDEG